MGTGRGAVQADGPSWPALSPLKGTSTRPGSGGRAASPRKRPASTHRGAGGIAERLIRRSCRRLPASTRDERYREWAAEVLAILEDPDVRHESMRQARALSYALGIWKCSHHPRLTGGRQAVSPRRAAFVRVTRGIGIYLGVLGVLARLAQVLPVQGLWPTILLLVLAVCFDGFCLVDLARAREVRYLAKPWWVLACLIQTPFGGIMYLSAGRVRS
jgi:hypothetical protein